MLFAGNVLNSRFKMFRIDSEGDFKDRHIFLVIESVESIPRASPPCTTFLAKRLELRWVVDSEGRTFIR